MWIERLMAGISHQHVLSYNPKKNGLYLIGDLPSDAIRFFMFIFVQKELSFQCRKYI